MSKRILHTSLFALACAAVTGATASAHPHVWVTMKAEVIYAPDGSAKAVRHIWTFDDMFSVFAIQGIDSKKKDEFTREELMPLAKENVESLKEFDYFMAAKVNGKKAEFVEPAEYHLDYNRKETVLTLHFTLPFKSPVKTKDLEVEVYDQSYFVEFSLAKNEPAALVGAPRECKLTVVRPEEMDAALAAQLNQLGPGQQLDPSAYLGAQFANKILVKCP
jgi:ABC-type uncharacterized transport system substrate-binding protein